MKAGFVIGRLRDLGKVLARTLAVTIVLVSAPATARAEMQWIAFRTVPPSPFVGNTHSVVVDIYAEEGMVECESFCYYYDDRVDESTFALTVNGESRTGAMTLTNTNYWCDGIDEYGNWVCHWTYVASGSPQLYFNGQTNTLRASIMTFGIAYWYEMYDLYQYVTPPTIEVIAAKPASTIEKGACVAFGIAPDVATECGVLRITHPLPTVRTFNKMRVPTLLYYHDQVSLWAPLGVNVLIPVGQSQPQEVRVDVTDPASAAVLATKTLSGSPFSPGSPQRVNLSLAIASDRPTGLLPYRLKITYKRSGVWEPTYVTIDGELSIVNRQASGFGPGWWLAGLERLHVGQTASRILWVGGDGSTRVYTPTTTTNPRLYHATPIDRTDSLVWNGTSQRYTRYLPHGVRVIFDQLGRHIETRNRLEHVTTFAYRPDSTYFLASIAVPGALTYQFNYTSGKLTSISSPGTSGVRTTSIVRQGTESRIKEIVDPTVVAGRTDKVVFDHVGTTAVVLGRTDRRGVRTEFVTEAGAPTLATASTPLAIGGTVTHTFRTVRAQNLTTLVTAHIDSAYTRYDAPRPLSDAADHRKFWVNGLGAPVKIADAYNKLTTIVYDTLWQGHVARVVRANGFTDTATYDARGNLATLRAKNPYGEGQDELTTFQWDAKWDFLTYRKSTLISPLLGQTKRIARFGYDNTTGNRIWEEPESNDAGTPESSRINYVYYTSGTANRLLKVVVLPGTGIRDSVGYDALGNLSVTRTPLGWHTWFHSDAIGRQTVARTQLEGAFGTPGTAEQHDSTFYDALGQVTRTVSHGPRRDASAFGYFNDSTAIQAVVAESFYGPEGHLDSLRRSSRPDAALVGVIVTRWAYDNAGRRIAETAPDGLVDSTGYDLAGNVVRARTRRNHVITMTYDANHRLTHRYVPAYTYGARAQGIGAIAMRDVGQVSYPWYGTDASTGLPTGPSGDLTMRGDTVMFAYDDVGNLIRADNADALIRRSYYANGQLETDTLKIRSYHTRDTTSHVYGLMHHYGVAGFRHILRHPDQLAPVLTGAGADSARLMLFEPDERGGIERVRDPLGNTYTFERNDRYELTEENFDGDIYRFLTYDADGRLVGDTVRNVSIGYAAQAHPDTLLRASRISYRDATRIGLIENGLGMQDTVRSWYSGLGQLARLEYRQPARSSYGVPAKVWSTERFYLDGLGNRFDSRDSTNLTSRTGVRNQVSTTSSVYQPASGQPATGRLRFVNSPHRTDGYEYDQAGNLVFQYTSGGWTAFSTTTLEDHASFYGTDGLLRVSEQRILTRTSAPEQDWLWSMTFEEYRYDALGRRVMVRTRRQCRNGASDALDAGHPCQLGWIRRTVWDGAQELYEIQRPGRDADFSTPAVMNNDTQPTDLNLFLGSITFDPNPIFGVVAYTHGLGLDRPVAVTRLQYASEPYGQSRHVFAPFSIVPHWDIRGAASFGTMADDSWGSFSGPHDGAYRICRPGSTTLCIQPAWRLRSFAFAQAAQAPFTWNGTLLEDKEDATGRVYRRNRYVDPATGRFTQEDPIGLAGGLNLYGFAAGDPVNFGDPFGLCPGIEGTDPTSVDDCPDENSRGFWDRLLNGPRYGVNPITGERERIARGVVPGWMGGPSGINLFSGARAALRSIFKLSSMEGVSGMQGLKLYQVLRSGGDEATLVTGEGGSVIATVIQRYANGARKEIIRTIARDGTQTSALQRTFDAAGNLLEETVLK